MLCSRMKQFREYNGLSPEHISEFIGISPEEYAYLESGEETPNIDIIEKLAKCYKVTIEEFYGYSPRLSFYNENNKSNNNVEEKILKMSDLSWEESQLILYFRSIEEKDDIISEIIKRRFEND